MRHALWKGLAVGAAVGALAGRSWRKRLRYGPWGSLGLGLPEGVDSVGLALMQTTATSMLEGNRLAWRDNGEIFGAIEEAIRSARHSIHVDVYIWKPGQPGERLAELVCRRARGGGAGGGPVRPVGGRGVPPPPFPRP